MEILVLNGSPRKNGNTSSLLKAFREGAQSSGHKVVQFDVAHMNIHGCIGCDSCYKEGNTGCVQKDDMYEIYPVYDRADMIVFASPVYFHGLTGQMQSAITRFYPHIPPKARKSALVLSSGSPNMYDPMTIQYQRIIRYFKCENMGIKAFDGTCGEEELRQMREFGANL